MWPPSSSDIILMDCAILSILERDISTRCYPNSDLLTVFIQSAMTKLGEKEVWGFCASVKGSLKLIIKAKGGHFGILYVHYNLITLLLSCVEAFFHSPSVIIFIRVFRWVNLSGPPCISLKHLTATNYGADIDRPDLVI